MPFDLGRVFLQMLRSGPQMEAVDCSFPTIYSATLETRSFPHNPSVCGAA